MDMEDNFDSEIGEDLFQEPEDYYQPEKKPTMVQYKTISGDILSLHLIGSSPLWVSALPLLPIHPVLIRPSSCGSSHRTALRYIDGGNRVSCYSC